MDETFVVTVEGLLWGLLMGGLLMDETFVVTIEGLLWGSSY